MFKEDIMILAPKVEDNWHKDEHGTKCGILRLNCL